MGISSASTESHLSNSKTLTTSCSELTGSCDSEIRGLHHSVSPQCCGHCMGEGSCQLPCCGSREVLSQEGTKGSLRSGRKHNCSSLSGTD